MQKVHGPPIETLAPSRHGYLDQPVLGGLVVSLLLLLALSAFIYFGFFGTS
jgi:hypothetical protein